MILFGCLPVVSINEHQQPQLSLVLTTSIACSTSCPGRSIFASYWPSINFSHISAGSFADSTRSILYFRNSPIIEHLYDAVSKLENVKRCTKDHLHFFLYRMFVLFRKLKKSW